jgi:hypothetical protein
MRRVHAIRHSTENASVCISFIQHGNEEEGFEYENICPWCATTLGFHKPPDPYSEKALFNLLREQMASHIQVCGAGGFKLQVEVTTVPLNTEKKMRIM